MRIYLLFRYLLHSQRKYNYKIPSSKNGTKSSLNKIFHFGVAMRANSLYLNALHYFEENTSQANYANPTLTLSQG